MATLVEMVQELIDENQRLKEERQELLDLLQDRGLAPKVLPRKKTTKKKATKKTDGKRHSRSRFDIPDDADKLTRQRFHSHNLHCRRSGQPEKTWDEFIEYQAGKG